MTVDPDKLAAQFANHRYRNGRHERLENGEWRPWPVLTMDQNGRNAVAREIARGRDRQNGFGVPRERSWR